MQALKSLFSRAQAPQAVVPAPQPVELSADSLKLVAGGALPRVSEEALTATPPEGTDLPRVS